MLPILATLLLSFTPAPVQGSEAQGADEPFVQDGAVQGGESQDPMGIDPRFLDPVQTGHEDEGSGVPIGVLTRGGVQAPRQPVRGSRSSVSRTARYEPRSEHASRPGSLDSIQTPVRGLVAVRGQEENVLIGVGLVVGLAGTGDSGEAAKILQQNALRTQNLNLDLQALSTKNMAVVLAEATLSAGLKPGRAIDVRVSSIGDAKSLVGGVLLLTELTDMTGATVYATASGPLTVGGFSAQGDSATATRNHVTVGVLPGGGKVEREIPTRVVSETGTIYLDVKPGQDSFGNVVRINDAVNLLYPGVARTMADGKSIRIEVPLDLPEEAHIAFLDTILAREVISESVARVILNERTGVIVMGGDVRLRPGVITKGNLTVTVAETPEVSQPGGLSGGETQVVDRTQLGVEEENNGLVLVPGAATLQEVVDVLNVLGASPRDLITILSSMSEAGMLVAEIRRI
jgi:flagellar P-ring protein precursor FlgI